MKKRTSKARLISGEAHPAQSEPPLFNTITFFSSTHPQAWVNKLCIDEGCSVLKGV